jgi:hypothetical protein
VVTLCTASAGVAQLVEHHVANVVVVGSNPITRFPVLGTSPLLLVAPAPAVPAFLQAPLFSSGMNHV